MHCGLASSPGTITDSTSKQTLLKMQMLKKTVFLAFISSLALGLAENLRVEQAAEQKVQYVKAKKIDLMVSKPSNELLALIQQESAKDSCKPGICCTSACVVQCLPGEICCFDSSGDYYCNGRKN